MAFLNLRFFCCSAALEDIIFILSEVAHIQKLSQWLRLFESYEAAYSEI